MLHRSDHDGLPSSAPAHTASDAVPVRSWLVLTTIALASAIVALDGTIVLVAQPALQADLGASLPQVQWVTTGYLLAVGSCLIIAGGFGDRLGNRYAFFIGLAGFTAASGALSCVHQIHWLIGLRVVQGLCGAVLQPSTLALLRRTYADDRLNMPIAIRTAAIGLSTATGPVIGGILVQYISWQAVFLINVPLGAITLVLGLWVLPRYRSPGRWQDRMHGLDLAGAGLLGALLLTAFFAIGQIARHGLSSATSMAAITVVAVLGQFFSRRQRTAPDPLLPLALTRSRTLRIGFVLVLCLAFSMTGTLFVATYYLQNQLGLDPVKGSLVVLPLTATMVVASPLCGHLLGSVRAAWLVGAGLFLTATAVLGLSRLGSGRPTVGLGLLLVLLGLGLTPALVGTTKIMVAGLPRSVSGLAGGLHQTGMQVGGAVGVSVMGALLGSRADHLLTATLRRSGLDPHAAFARTALADASVGRHRPITGMPEHLAATWSTLSTSIFMHALSYALLAGALVALIGALLSPLAGRTGPGGHTGTPQE